MGGVSFCIFNILLIVVIGNLRKTLYRGMNILKVKRKKKRVSIRVSYSGEAGRDTGVSGCPWSVAFKN